VEPQRAVACSRLALGDADRARLLASAEGDALRRDAERVVLAALDAQPAEPAGEEPWRALLTRAEQRRAAVEQELAARSAARLELEPTGRERRAIERSLEESGKREGRRARTEVLELGLELAALSFRDMACAAEGAQAAVLATDRPELLAAGAAQPSSRLREAVERCEEVRESLTLNVGEELALAALGFRLKALLGSPVG
jgi:hypothetical protein